MAGYFTSASILRNTATGRYHPILFRASPTYSRPERQKSAGHHTEGFATEEEAVAFLAEHHDGMKPDVLLEWDGIGIPAMVI